MPVHTRGLITVQTSPFSIKGEYGNFQSRVVEGIPAMISEICLISLHRMAGDIAICHNICWFVILTCLHMFIIIIYLELIFIIRIYVTSLYRNYLYGRSFLVNEYSSMKKNM